MLKSIFIEIGMMAMGQMFFVKIEEAVKLDDVIQKGLDRSGYGK
jgi:hypothetical protein